MGAGCIGEGHGDKLLQCLVNTSDRPTPHPAASNRLDTQGTAAQPPIKEQGAEQQLARQVYLLLH